MKKVRGVWLKKNKNLNIEIETNGDAIHYWILPSLGGSLFLKKADTFVCSPFPTILEETWTF